jgi:hypothetical protein
LKLWYIDHGVIQKIHILQILLQRYGLLRGREKTTILFFIIYDSELLLVVKGGLSNNCRLLLSLPY